MKMYERLIPENTKAEKAFEDFCTEHGITPCQLRQKSNEYPYPSLRKKFARKAHKELHLTHNQIAEAMNISRNGVTNYLNGYR